ncbi:MAG TPA: fumarylacetoacetate hydrolase family protein [Stellaceae bacterium]|jgi:fumarylacetoacetate (FAA) hydrolase|nr:fumarylacetoacetate hydrolase family protein [Stellaceae bacterium]
MKLATLKAGGRDGTLVVVSRDLAVCATGPQAARTLQEALDDWPSAEPELREIYRLLNYRQLDRALPFDAAAAASPLPRAYQWADGSAYLHHAELVRKARKAEMPQSLYSDPLMYQGGSDSFIGPADDILAGDEAWGIDFEAEIAVVTDDVPMGTAAAAAGTHIRLVMLANDVSLRNLIPGELAKGFGFFHSKPATAFSPVAVTPDELGEAWDGGKLHLPLVCQVNGKEFGRPDAGRDMNFDFPALIAHAARTRELEAGSIIGSGTVSNRNPEIVGSCCIAERRMLETIAEGAPKSPFLRFGDRVRIEMFDAQGRSIFGAIDQKVVPYRDGR